MIKKSFFDKEVIIFKPDVLLEHFEFIQLVIEKPPKWITYSLKHTDRWSFIKQHNLLIGLVNINDNYPELIVDYPMIIRETDLFITEIEYGKCPNCQTEYSALNIRDYTLYAGFTKATYEWAMNVPYISQCLYCSYDWDQPGRRFLAIYQGNKEKYSI